MVLTFDTQQIYRSLASEGNFTEAQAQTITDALREVASLNIEHLASKDDLELLRKDVDAARKDLEYMEDRVNGRLQDLEHRLTIKLGGMMVVGLGVIVALQQMLGG